VPTRGKAASINPDRKAIAAKKIMPVGGNAVLPALAEFCDRRSYSAPTPAMPGEVAVPSTAHRPVHVAGLVGKNAFRQYTVVSLLKFAQLFVCPGPLLEVEDRDVVVFSAFDTTAVYPIPRTSEEAVICEHGVAPALAHGKANLQFAHESPLN
jgi:hypothetical protein